MMTARGKRGQGKIIVGDMQEHKEKHRDRCRYVFDLGSNARLQLRKDSNCQTACQKRPKELGADGCQERGIGKTMQAIRYQLWIDERSLEEGQCQVA